MLYEVITSLEECGVPIGSAAEIVANRNVADVRAKLAARARAHFAAAHDALTAEDARALLPARLMMAAYLDVLDRIERNGWTDLPPPPRPSRITSYNVCYTKLLRDNFV